MAYKNSLSFGNKKNRLLGILIVLTIIGAGLTVGLFTGHVYLDTTINRSTSNVETISQSTQALKAEVETVKKQQTDIEKELAKVEDHLAKYEPVVIPDSMK